MPNLIALAIPFFFLLMGVELWAASRRRVKLYRFADVIADISCGMTQQIFLVFAVAVITRGPPSGEPKPPVPLPAGSVPRLGAGRFALHIVVLCVAPPSQMCVP